MMLGSGGGTRVSSGSGGHGQLEGHQSRHGWLMEPPLRPTTQPRVNRSTKFTFAASGAVLFSLRTDSCDDEGYARIDEFILPS